MHDFGWKCDPVERAGTVAPRSRDAGSAGAGRPVSSPAASTTLPLAGGTVRPASTGEQSNATGKPSAAMTPATDRKSTTIKPRAIGKPTRPKGLSEARGGEADNLQLISGVGPKLEKTLHSLGFYHFDQIAEWNRDEVEWVDEHLRFKGRIDRDEWIRQARQFAAGGMN